jgi:hypothetical protein
MIRDVDQATADLLVQVLEAQKIHLQELEGLRQALTSSTGDISLPAEVDAGTAGKR